jgi:glutathione S-transferase
MLQLLGRATSGNVQKVMFLLEELGTPYERVDYGRQFNNTQTAEYKALNPNAKVPTLVDGETSTWESNTILRYLAALHAPAMHGNSPGEKTQVERWMDWLLASVNAPYLAMFRDAKKPEAERAADFEAQRKELVALMQILDAQLAGKDFVVLHRLTLADIALAPIMARCLAFPIDKPALPNLERWCAAMAARPAFQKATSG